MPAVGGHWVHLRRCTECGHVGCCDNSPNRHATAHFHETAHPIIQSFEPGEDWYCCYVDDLAFELDGEAPSPSHPESGAARYPASTRRVGTAARVDRELTRPRRVVAGLRHEEPADERQLEERLRPRHRDRRR